MYHGGWSDTPDFVFTQIERTSAISVFVSAWNCACVSICEDHLLSQMQAQRLIFVALVDRSFSNITETLSCMLNFASLISIFCRLVQIKCTFRYNFKCGHDLVCSEMSSTAGEYIKSFLFSRLNICSHHKAKRLIRAFHLQSLIWMHTGSSQCTQSCKLTDIHATECDVIFDVMGNKIKEQYCCLSCVFLD